MNKAELIEALAQHYDGSKADATKALNAVVQTITYSAAAGEKVAITGFGVFEKVDRPARMVRNPRTGERKEAAATSVPRFRPGTELKAYVSGARPVPATGAETPARTPVRRVATRNGSESAGTTPAPAPAAPAPAAKSKDSKNAAKASTQKTADKKASGDSKASTDKKSGSAKKASTDKKISTEKDQHGQEERVGQEGRQRQEEGRQEGQVRQVTPRSAWLTARPSAPPRPPGRRAAAGPL